MCLHFSSKVLFSRKKNILMTTCLSSASAQHCYGQLWFYLYISIHYHLLPPCLYYKFFCSSAALSWDTALVHSLQCFPIPSLHAAALLWSHSSTNQAISLLQEKVMLHFKISSSFNLRFRLKFPTLLLCCNGKLLCMRDSLCSFCCQQQLSCHYQTQLKEKKAPFFSSLLCHIFFNKEYIQQLLKVHGFL